MQGQRIGYVRVSSFDQNPERQLEHVEVGRVFTDKASGKSVLEETREVVEGLVAGQRGRETRQQYRNAKTIKHFKNSKITPSAKATPAAHEPSSEEERATMLQNCQTLCNRLLRQ